MVPTQHICYLLICTLNPQSAVKLDQLPFDYYLWSNQDHLPEKSIILIEFPQVNLCLNHRSHWMPSDSKTDNANDKYFADFFPSKLFSPCQHGRIQIDRWNFLQSHKGHRKWASTPEIWRVRKTEDHDYCQLQRQEIVNLCCYTIFFHKRFFC